MILTFSFQNINLYGHNSETVSGTQIRTRSVLGWMQIMLVVGQVSANLFRTERWMNYQSATYRSFLEEYQLKVIYERIW